MTQITIETSYWVNNMFQISQKWYISIHIRKWCFWSTYSNGKCCCWWLIWLNDEDECIETRMQFMIYTRWPTWEFTECRRFVIFQRQLKSWHWDMNERSLICSFIFSMHVDLILSRETFIIIDQGKAMIDKKTINDWH